MFPFLWMDVYEGPICVAERIAGPRTAAAGTSDLPNGGGVAHGPGRRSREGGAPIACATKPWTTRRHEDPNRSWNQSGSSCNSLQAACGGARRRAGGSRLSRSSHIACFALMRASSTLPGFLASEWRDSNPRPRGPQPRALPTAPHSVARQSGLEPESAVLETAVLPIAPLTQREASTAPRASARSSGRQTPRTPLKSPEPDSNRRPAAYEAAALPLGHRGEAVPPIAFSMHVESLSARVPYRARHGRNRLVEPAGFGPATFPLRTGCAASAPRPRAIPSLYAREGTVGKGVIQVAALRRWCPRPDSNRRRPP